MIVRRLRVFAAVLISAAALAGVGRLVLPATGGPEGEPPGVRGQLAFLRSALENGAGDRAQGLFPEGYFFLHALYGLTWVELGMREPAGGRAAALREARWALSRLDSPAGRAPFDAGLTPPYGVFYAGWTVWLRGGILALQPPAARNRAEVARFEADAAGLGAAFDAAASPFLAAYPGQAWPVDSTVAMAALKLHDALLPPRFGQTAQRWLRAVQDRLDPRTGLLPHRVDLDTGAPAEVARGSSQSIIQRFLPEVDLAFARDQYTRFRDRFVDRPLRLGPAVREYPKGMDGPSDVDSGPLPLGISLSATVVTAGAAQVEGDGSLAGSLANYGELAGVPLVTPWTKRYALGALPIGDAFLAWSKTARPWTVPSPSPPPDAVPRWWRVSPVALLVLVAAAPWLWLARPRRLARAETAGRMGA